VLVGLVVFVGAPSSASAQQSARIDIRTTVIRHCTIRANPLDFGNYDPIQANDTNPLDGTTQLIVRCTKGTRASIALDMGKYQQGANRRMFDGSEFLTYSLYQDSGRSTPWGGPVRRDLAVAINFNPRQVEVFGRVPPAQDVAANVYLDEVVATVEF
jgi:spore coat protein U-like protein